MIIGTQEELNLRVGDRVILREWENGKLNTKSRFTYTYRAGPKGLRLYSEESESVALERGSSAKFEILSRKISIGDRVTTELHGEYVFDVLQTTELEGESFAILSRRGVTPFMMSVQKLRHDKADRTLEEEVYAKFYPDHNGLMFYHSGEFEGVILGHRKIVIKNGVLEEVHWKRG